MDEQFVERCAREIAVQLGDRLAGAFENKTEWNAARGDKGNGFRDINMPFKSDYLDAARAVLAILPDPLEGRRQALEDAMQACRDQAKEFLSEEYATPQPVGSTQERFACSECEGAIRALIPNPPASGDGQWQPIASAPRDGQ